MNDLFWLCILFPAIWPFLAKVLLPRQVNWWETGAGLLVTIGLITLVWSAGTSSKAKDAEIVNGEVTGEHMERVSCSHTYSCNCHSVTTYSKKHSHSHIRCDTCRKHAYDQNWVIETTLGNFNINPVDSQGLTQPPRYSSVRKGDLVSTSQSYNNWVAGAADGLVANSDQGLERYEGKLPDYPGKIYDYYHVDRLVDDGVNVPDSHGWNRAIATMIHNINPYAQVNAVVVFTNDPSPDYATALKSYWKGAKANDVVTVIGAPNYPKITWARSFSWSKTSALGLELNQQLETLGYVNMDLILGYIATDIRKDYQARPMSDFLYLKDEIQPPLWASILCFLIGVPGSFLLSWLFYKVDFDPIRWWKTR